MDMSIPQVVEKISDLSEHVDKRFENIDRRFDEHDKRFDILSKQIYDVTARLDSLENNVSLMRKENFEYTEIMRKENLEYKDTVMKLLTRHDQEIVSINSRLKRIES